MKSGVEGLHTLPFGAGEFRNNWHSECRIFFVVVTEITLSRVPGNSVTP